MHPATRGKPAIPLNLAAIFRGWCIIHQYTNKLRVLFTYVSQDLAFIRDPAFNQENIVM